MQATSRQKPIKELLVGSKSGGGGGTKHHLFPRAKEMGGGHVLPLRSHQIVPMNVCPYHFDCDFIIMLKLQNHQSLNF